MDHLLTRKMCVAARFTIILTDEKQKTKSVGYVDSFKDGLPVFVIAD
jgi:hypothetical protein